MQCAVFHECGMGSHGCEWGASGERVGRCSALTCSCFRLSHFFDGGHNCRCKRLQPGPTRPAVAAPTFWIERFQWVSGASKTSRTACDVAGNAICMMSDEDLDASVGIAGRKALCTEQLSKGMELPMQQVLNSRVSAVVVC